MNPSDPVPLCFRRAVKALASLMMLMLCISAHAQLHTYEYQRKINAAAEGWYRIPLSPEVLARTKSGMNDLRIYNITGKDTVEIAYLQQSLGDKRTETAVPSELIRHSNTEKSYSIVTLKFPSKKLINEIILDVSESNFDKWIKVQGSTDNKKWTTIRERARIVGFDNGEADYRYTRLKFRPVEYTYFRLVMNDEWTNPITVTGAHAYQVRTDEGRYEDLAIQKQVIKENRQLKATEIYLDLAYEYHVDHLVISPKTKEDFYRNINVYRYDGGQKTKQGIIDRWVMISTGVFSSFGDYSHSRDTLDADGLPTTTLPCHANKAKRLKIEIINKDDQPVEIGSIKLFGETRQLVSKLPAGNVVLAFGKGFSPAPEYDLVYFRQNIPSTLNTASLGEERMISASSQKGEKEPQEAIIEDKIWMWIAMGVILLLIIVFSMSMLRKSA
jgi:hypothetical protein